MSGKTRTAVRRTLAVEYLRRADECDAETKRLKIPDGSTAHLCANVWRAASSIADPEPLIQRKREHDRA